MLRFEKENGSIDFDVNDDGMMIRTTVRKKISETDYNETTLLFNIPDDETSELIDFLQKRLGYRLNKKNK